MENLSVKKKRIITVAVLIAVIIFVGLISVFVGKPLIKFVSKPEKFRNWVNENGVLSRLAFIGMVVFQVVIAIVPGEPFEIGAGYAFGIIEGTLLCIIGVMLGSIIIFYLVRKWGIKVVEIFFPIEKIRSLKFLQNTKRLNLITFIVFFIPGTPKDLLSYAVGLTEINFSYWLFVSTVARFPSVVTSAAGGSALGSQKYTLAIIVFSVTLALSGIGLLIYKKNFEKNK